MIEKILSSIKNKLSQRYRDLVQVYFEGEKQELIGPCFFIAIVSSSKNKVLGSRCLLKNEFDIKYLSGSEDTSEIIRERSLCLYDVLNQIYLEDDLIYGTKMKYERLEDGLHFYVNFDLFLDETSELIEDMENFSTYTDMKGSENVR